MHRTQGGLGEARSQLRWLRRARWVCARTEKGIDRSPGFDARARDLELSSSRSLDPWIKSMHKSVNREELRLERAGTPDAAYLMRRQRILS